jgi:hypothetical protein
LLADYQEAASRRNTKHKGEALRLALQSCADEAKAAVLAEQNEGVRGFHGFNPNHWVEGWQAAKKH